MAKLHQIFVYIACGCRWFAMGYVLPFFVDVVIFSHSALCGASCVFVSGESITAKTTASVPTRFCSWTRSSRAHCRLCSGSEVCYLRLRSNLCCTTSQCPTAGVVSIISQLWILVLMTCLIILINDRWCLWNLNFWPSSAST